MIITKMPSDARKFEFSQEPEPHRNRTKQLLSSHPELRRRNREEPLHVPHHRDLRGPAGGDGLRAQGCAVVGNRLSGVPVRARTSRTRCGR